MGEAQVERPRLEPGLVAEREPAPELELARMRTRRRGTPRERPM